MGNQTHVTDTVGRVTRSWYDDLNRLISTTVNFTTTFAIGDHGPGNEWNVTTWYGYDEVGNQVWVTDTLERATFTEYDELNRPVTVTTNYEDGEYDPAHPDQDLINVTMYDDETGRVTARIDPAGRETRYGYDDLGRTVTVTTNYTGTGEYDPAHPDQNLVSLTIYDDETGQVTARVQVADSRITTTYEYDVVGRLVTTTNALSGTSVTHYDALGRRAETIDAEGQVTRYGYDALGRMISTTVNYSPTVGANFQNEWNITTLYGYDPLGRRIAVTDALTHTTVYTYDVAGRLVEQRIALTQQRIQYGYDALGRRTVVTDADGVAVYSVYDGLGRLVETRDELDNRTQYGYDALDSREVMTNARGYATRYEYDGVGRLITVTENYTTTPGPEHQTNVQTEYEYDVSGNLIAVTDALTNTTVYTYDLAGRRIAEEDALGHVTAYVYDGHGRRVKEVYPDASGPITVTAAHNALGWPTQIEYPAIGETPGFTVEYSYDALGHRDTVTDATGAITYNYDALYQPLAIGAPTGEAEYLYDAAGRRTHLVYPDGKTVTYTHDAANRLLTVTDWASGTTVYTYTPAGRLSEMLLPNNVETRYDYDDAGRLVEIEHRNSQDNLLARYKYELDRVGNRVVVTETMATQPTTSTYHIVRDTIAAGGGVITSTSFTIRATVGQIDVFSRTSEHYHLVGGIWTAADAPTPAASVVTATRAITYTYDPLGRLVDADYSTGESFEYAFDEVGNRKALTSTTPLSGTLVTTYTYDAANRLTDRVVSDGRVYSYTWSARGQMLAEWTQGYPVRTFTYDGAGQMVEATVFTLTTRFRYNGLGARVAVEVVGQGATTYTLDYAAGNRILAETTDADNTLYLYGRDCLGELRDGDWLYYLSDAEGLVRQGVDEQGWVVSNWLFDPDGTMLEGPEGPVSHLVCGGVYDWSTGLIYKDGRYFDPMLGIWLALMPLVVVQSWRGRKKKQRGFLWVWLLLLGVCVGGILTACGGGGGSPLPTPTVCTEITTPFGSSLGNNAVFVDPPSSGQYYRPQAQMWQSGERQTVEAALTDVVNNKFGGQTGFGSRDAALAAFKVSAQNPIRLFREPAGSHPDARAGASYPDIAVYNSWFLLGNDPTLQKALLGHEMAHYWDQANDHTLSEGMQKWINWGQRPTELAENSLGEAFAEAVRIYFWPKQDGYDPEKMIPGIIRPWTDDMGFGWEMATNPAYYGGPGVDGLKLTEQEINSSSKEMRWPSVDGTVQVYDRYDWLECKFRGNCLAPLIDVHN